MKSSIRRSRAARSDRDCAGRARPSGRSARDRGRCRLHPAGEGLVLTSTVHSTFVVSGGGGADRSYSGTDVEEWDSVVDATAEAIVYQLRVSAPADAQANADLAKFVIHRSVRREDIAQATRINLFYSSVDPQMFADRPSRRPP